MAACPRLTELTVWSNPYDTRTTETGVLHDPAGIALSVISELIVACEALPDFDTFQILHVPAFPPSAYWYGLRISDKNKLYGELWEQSRMEQARVMRDFAIDCLKTLKSRRHEGEGRKRTVVRMVRVGPTLSVKVEEYEV